MVEENVAIRLKGFIDSQGLTNSQFADQCGIPRPSLSQLLTGRNKKISDVIIAQIHQAFPQLSILWLLFGEGEMLVGENEKTERNSSPAPQNSSERNSSESDIPLERSNPSIQGNLTGLTTPPVGFHNIDPQSVNNEKKNMELLREIDKLRKNPRKAVQITVYYDDSTFETFYPGK